MSLGTGALKVGREPVRLRHSMKVSMTTMQVGTTPACSCQLAPSVENSHLTPILIKAQRVRDRLQQILKDQLKNASMRCNVSHKISKRPLQSPHRSHTLEEEIADRIGLQFNFA